MNLFRRVGLLFFILRVNATPQFVVTMGKGVLFVVLLHCCACLAETTNETTAASTSVAITVTHLEEPTNSSSVVAETLSKPTSPPTTILNLPGIGTSPENVTLSLQTQGDGIKKTVPRKGIPKDPVKGRKGAEPTDDLNVTTSLRPSPTPVVKFKPLASEAVKSEDEVSEPPSHQTALIVGLSLGIAMVLILAAVTFWRLRDVWERRQYKRVDFLVDGMYTDT